VKQKSLRIIAGRDRGRKIIYEESEGLRPTPDRVRENLFNILQSDIPNAAVLDLFAGTGAFAFEALSRGADNAVIADKSGDCIKNIKRNIDALKTPSIKYRILHSDYSYTIKMLFGQKFDIIYIDPPYNADYYDDCIEKLLGGGLVSDGGFIVAEMPFDKEVNLPQNAVVTDTRAYGSVKLMFIELTAEKFPSAEGWQPTG